MDAESLVAGLVRFQLVASGAILVVLLLRKLALRLCGAAITYWLWIVVPLAALAAVLPASERVVVLTAASEVAEKVDATGVVSHALERTVAAPPGHTGSTFDAPGFVPLIALWLSVAGVLLARSIVSTRRLAANPLAGPALVGVLRPRLLLPMDFKVRFNADERALILAHELVHRVSRHATVNALVEFARCVSWFNPLVHHAATRFRADQELACDTAVIAAYPHARHTYAETLLKAQMKGMHVPMGCMWSSGSARRLAERLERLSEQLPGRRRRLAGAASILLVGTAAGYTAWAQQPAQVITVQRANMEQSAELPTATAVEAPTAAGGASPGAPSPGRPWSAAVPAQMPSSASSTVQPAIAEERKPQAHAATNAGAIALAEENADVTSGTRAPIAGGGIPVTSARGLTGAQDPNAIPSDLARRMDVVTGGASSSYGAGAMVGVVELVLNNRNGIRSPSAEFSLESVDKEWSSAKRDEILQSLVPLEGELSITTVECRSASCAVTLTWPAPAADSVLQRQRHDRIARWVQEVSGKSGFVRSEPRWLFDQPTVVIHLTTKPISKPVVPTP